MEVLKIGWDFFQKEVLGMQWLNRLIGSIVEAVGLDPTSRIGGSIQFFFYDVIKINFMWYAVFGLIATWGVGYVISLLTFSKERELQK